MNKRAHAVIVGGLAVVGSRGCPGPDVPPVFLMSVDRLTATIRLG